MFIFQSGFQPLNYGWTLLVAFPVALAQDAICQGFEMSVLRKVNCRILIWELGFGDLTEGHWARNTGLGVFCQGRGLGV